MAIIDAHLHCTGRERADDVLRTPDAAGVDMAVLIAPFLGEATRWTMRPRCSVATRIWPGWCAAMATAWWAWPR
ncbi:hypothetical protein [Pseudorhodoferax aquiterrae]|uniref:hypothetical protein n=1 Tax=Pseudorhodoferax aquiterrae TaxID=747304 RepID=UPI0016733687|nr:hypothetical protein [Pseudorhodoferax aquiterrae]